MTDKPRFMTPDEVTVWSEGKLSRNNVYGALKSGALEHIRIGRRILVTEEALSKWLQSLTVKAS